LRDLQVGSVTRGPLARVAAPRGPQPGPPERVASINRFWSGIPAKFERAKGGPKPLALSQKEEKRYRWFAWPMMSSGKREPPDCSPCPEVARPPWAMPLNCWHHDTTPHRSLLDGYLTPTLRSTDGLQHRVTAKLHNTQSSGILCELYGFGEPSRAQGTASRCFLLARRCARNSS
jgi:hypothetical protein